MKTKSGLVGIIAALTLAGCGTLHGTMDLSYLPNKTDDKVLENLTKQEFNMYYRIPIKDMYLDVGGIQRTYTELRFDWDFPYIFNPVRQEYEIYTNLTINKDWELYARHLCSHPVNSEEFWLWKDKVPYIIGHDSNTEFGLKVKF